MMSTDHANDNVRRAVPSRINGKRILWRDFDNRTKALQIYNKGLEYIKIGRAHVWTPVT